MRKAAEAIPLRVPTEDREAICDIIHRYAFYSDTAQYRMMPTLFTEDAVFDETCLGFPIRRGMAELQQIFSVPSDKYIYFVHFISNILFKSYDGTTATSTSYLRGEGILSSGARPLILGYYDDVFEKTASGWLIKQRRLVPFAPPSGFVV